MAFLGRAGGTRTTAGRPSEPSSATREQALARPIVTTGVLLGLAATVGVLVYPVVPFLEAREGFGVVAGPPNDGLGVVNTASGPLTPADRDFMVKVRLAGLWELPSGSLAQTKSRNPAVLEAGMHLTDGHTVLDRDVIQVAQALRVRLPNEPNAQQKGWLSQMRAAKGEEFDQTFTDLLRSAHGKVLPLVAETRSKTQNTLVRALADRANAIVLDHMQILEKTGKVNFDALAQ